MRAAAAIFRRELKSYFASPVAYIVLVVFTVLSGVFFFIYMGGFLQSQYDPRFQFYGGRLNLNEFVVAPYLGTINIVLLLMIPLVTMRLIAEERRGSTGEMLFTSPVRSYEIVLGKYLASLFLFAVMLVLSALHMVVLAIYGNPDPGPMLSGYLGVFLVGASFLAVGLFASSLTENQIVAAVIAFGVLLLFWVIGASSDTGESVLGYLSIVNHFEAFTRGVIETRDIVYYLSMTAMGLFLTHIALESEKWR